MAQEKRTRGEVVTFHDGKGFGFIKLLDGAADQTVDLFVHHSEIKAEGHRTLFTGQVVEFVVSEEGKKLKALDVTVISGGPPSRGGGCYTCGKSGHIARECESGNGNGNVRGRCYHCGNPGHFAKECDQVEGQGGGGHGGGGHGGGGQGGNCYTCGKPGHFSKECDQIDGQREGRFEGGCYTCGGVGHVAKVCPTGRRGGCYTCGGQGHMAKECRGVGVGGGNVGRFGQRPKGCFTCGEEGHLARDCVAK